MEKTVTMYIGKQVHVAVEGSWTRIIAQTSLANTVTIMVMTSPASCAWPGRHVASRQLVGGGSALLTLQGCANVYGQEKFDH